MFHTSVITAMPLTSTIDSKGLNMITVLIADDDDRLLNMLRRTLVYEGFNVVTASDGREALSEIGRHHPNVIILDWLMPGLDGIEVTKRLRAVNDETMILMLTARDAIEDRVEGLDSGADDYLVKPFAPAELLARIHALLRRADVINKEESLSYIDLDLDPSTREVWRGGPYPDRVRFTSLFPAPSPPGTQTRSDSGGGLGV